MFETPGWAYAIFSVFPAHIFNLGRAVIWSDASGVSEILKFAGKELPQGHGCKPMLYTMQNSQTKLHTV